MDSASNGSDFLSLEMFTVINILSNFAYTVSDPLRKIHRRALTGPFVWKVC